MSRSQKRRSFFYVLGFVLPAAALALLIYFMGYTGSVTQDLADNLIRLHVVANSDSAEDQALKLKVRDTVVNYMDAQLKDSNDIEHTKSIINQNINNIKLQAESEIQKDGSSYPVSVSLGIYPFPEKKYGDVTLPPGNYQALKVVIGKGEGKNWWCVIFPPLCFVDATHSKIADSMKDQLKKSLTNEEYKLIMSADDQSDIPIRVKFKIVEVFQDAKMKFSSFFSKVLGSGTNTNSYGLSK